MISILVTFCFLVIGCSASPGEGEGGLLSKKQVLKENPNADLFVFEGKVYKNGVDWIEEQDLTKDAQIGEIKKGMATELPIGAKIFQTREKKGILIVQYRNTEKRYLLRMGE
ncbi:hypothetical protein LD39_00295 [Halobacillus sp. BBL2006]|nr:hypothetical protein LD39_00295 [Halobacillus sp. BBL2006]